MDKFKLHITNYTGERCDDDVSLCLKSDTDEKSVLKMHLRNEFKDMITNILSDCKLYVHKVYIEDCREDITDNPIFRNIISNAHVRYFSVEIGFDATVESQSSSEFAELYIDYNFEGCVERWLNILNSVKQIDILKLKFYGAKIMTNAIQMFLDFLEQMQFLNVILDIPSNQERIERCLDISDKWELISDNSCCKLKLKPK